MEFEYYFALFAVWLLRKYRGNGRKTYLSLYSFVSRPPDWLPMSSILYRLWELNFNMGRDFVTREIGFEFETEL